MCLVHLYQDWNEWQAVVNLLVSRNAGGFIDRPNNYFDFGRWMISGLRLEVDDSCALLGYYAASSGNFLPTIRDNLSVQPHGTVGCPERSVRSYITRCVAAQKRAVIFEDGSYVIQVYVYNLLK